MVPVGTRTSVGTASKYFSNAWQCSNAWQTCIYGGNCRGGRKGRKDTSAADLLIYQSCDRQAVEAVCESLPQANVIPPFAFVIEPINSIDGSALMVASQQEEVLRVLNLQSRYKSHGSTSMLCCCSSQRRAELLCTGCVWPLQPGALAHMIDCPLLALDAAEQLVSAGRVL